MSAPEVEYASYRCADDSDTELHIIPTLDGQGILLAVWCDGHPYAHVELAIPQAAEVATDLALLASDMSTDMAAPQNMLGGAP